MHTRTSSWQRAQVNTRPRNGSSVATTARICTLARGPSACSEAIRTSPLDVIPERCNTLPALVANTVGRDGRNNLPVIAVVAPVLDNSAQFYRNQPRLAQTEVGVWGAAPCSRPHRGREAAPCTQGASTSSPAQPQQACQAPARGRSVGELHKVDSVGLRSRLFIFERLDLVLTDPAWPNRPADHYDLNPTQSARFGGSVLLSRPGSIPMSVKDFAVVQLGMRRIESLPDDENVPSCLVCELSLIHISEPTRPY